MAGRSSKPLSLVKGHRTKAEIETRKAAEEALITGTPMKEWDDVKNDPSAHKHFLRIRKLYKAIGKDDALAEPSINRYCIMLSECEKYQDRARRLNNAAVYMDEHKEEYKKLDDYVKAMIAIEKEINNNDRLLQSKRRDLLSIERSSLMTLEGQMRSIPKAPPKQVETGMEKFMKRRGESG